MAFIIKDRVKENTTSTGTGAISLGGAAATFDTFQSYMSNGDTTYYAIVHTTSGTDEWEVGLGTWNTGNTLTRTTVLAGSNGTSAVNFSAGTKDVFMTMPAAKAQLLDASGDVDIDGGTIDGTTIGATTADTGKFTTLETTSNADIGGYIDLKVLSDHAAYKEGRIWYDSIHKTINYYSDDSDVIHEVGLEEHQRVYNNTGSTISKGKPLYFSGNYTAGDIDVPTVGLADATDVNAYNAQGLAASDIPNNSYGYCIIAGQLDGVDTSGLSAGANFFVGLTPGAVQNASPVYPNFPMCLGWVVNSDATDGILLVNQQNHSVNSFRVRTDAHIGDDLIVGGNLQVLGTTTTTSTSDVTAGAPFYRANEGDAIGEAGTTFSGTGLDDAFFAGHFTGTTSTTYYVKIDSVGTPDTFAVSIDDFATTISTGNAITGNEQMIHSADNISVTFGATTGHTLNDKWTGTASPILVDSGFFTNRNTGTSGVGYTHMGFYYDVSEDKWVLLDEYDPTPSGAINLAHSSTSYATLKAGTFEGDLTGDVTGDVTGNASTADSLSTSRTIGGVSFNGTANIDLPGVNTSGNQDTTGNAATATALETSRTIQLTGDVTGSATFDGSANASITAVVQDDSHSHVISNVDGLQAALDDKADDTINLTAGNGLTGGGDLSANRTFAVGAGSGITVSADAVAHSDTSTQASVNNSGNTFIQDVTLDGFGHVTGLTSGSVSIGDATITISAGGGLQTGGNFTTNQSTNETITLAHADTSSQASVNNSGRTYIQDITLDTYGHITGITSATETVTNTNQLTTFQLEDGDGTEVTISHGKEVKFVEGTGIDINWTDTSTGSDGDPYDMTFAVTSAPKWTTARTLSLSGDASGSVSWDGSANATLSVTVANDSHTHDGRYFTETESDGRYLKLTGGTLTGELTVPTQLTISESSPQIKFNDTDSNYDFWIHVNSNNFYVLNDHDGNGAWDGNYPLQLEGDTDIGYMFGQRVFTDSYHPNADKWTTARTLSLSGDASGSVSWDGSANATLSVTVADNSHNHNNYTPIDHFRHTGHGYYTSTTTSALLTEALGDDAFDSKLTAHKTGWSYAGNGNLTDAGRFTELAGTSWLWWTDNSTDNVQGNVTALAIAPNTGGSAGKVFIYNNQGSSYSPGWREVWTSSSDGAGSGLDADKLDGYHLSTTRNSANTVPVRDGNGYLQLGWINTTSGATTSTINKIYASYDNYIRYVTPATLKSQLGVPSSTGSSIAGVATSGNYAAGAYTQFGSQAYLAVNLSNASKANSWLLVGLNTSTYTAYWGDSTGTAYQWSKRYRTYS